MVTSLKLEATNWAYKGKGKPYVARITGVGGKYGLQREFLTRSALITECGVYEVRNYDKKDREDTNLYLVASSSDGLEKFSVGDEFVVDFFQSGREASELEPYTDAAGKRRLRREDGALNWRTSAPDDEKSAIALLVARGYKVTR